jgi:hypothetical protein
MCRAIIECPFSRHRPETFDRRPVLMLHLTCIERGLFVSRPVITMAVHSILEAILHDRIPSYPHLAALTGGQQETR